MLKTYPLYIIWSTTPEFLKYEIKTTNILFIDFWKRLSVMTHVVHNTRKDKRSWKKPRPRMGSQTENKRFAKPMSI